MNQLELLAERFIDETDYEDQCCDELDNYEYQEVTLQRNRNNDRLGLTLCYTSEDDTDTDIFITEIEDLSIAGNDGRIKTGDQLLQVNGIDVHTRNEAMKLFNENRKDFTLLLARTPDEVLPTICTIEELEETLNFEPDKQHATNVTTVGHTPQLEESAGSAHEKDSGISRSTDSEPDDVPIVNKRSGSEKSLKDKLPLVPERLSLAPLASPQVDDNHETEQKQSRVPVVNTTTTTTVPLVTTPSCTSNEQSTDLDRSISLTGDGSSTISPECMSTAPSEPQTWGNRLYRSESEGNVSHELIKLNSEMETIQIECDRLVQRYAIQESRVRQQVAKAHQLVASLQHHFGLRSKDSRILHTTSSVTSSPLIPKQDTSCGYGQHRKSPLKDRRTVQKPEVPRVPEQERQFCHTQCKTPHGTVDEHKSAASEEPKPDIATGRTETSSAYHSGGDSSRSTPLHLSSSSGKSSQRHDSGLALSLKQVESSSRGRPDRRHSTSNEASQGDAPSCEVGHLGKPEPVYALPLRKRNPNNNSTFSSTLDKLRSRSVEKPSVKSSKSSAPVKGVGTKSVSSAHKFIGTNSQVVNRVPDVSNPSTSATMYATPNNLENTMRLQQRLLRQAMIQEAKELKKLQGQQPLSGRAPAPYNPVAMTSASSSMNDLDSDRIRLRWKVKRRSDGSHYIVHRPVRNRILRERAKKLATQRQGVTTDDDTVSELKTGRYWTREERKRHIERARERKRRQMELLQRQATLLESATGERNNMLELSSRMMTRKKCHQLTDRFTTIEEFLAHGSRSNNQTMGILSVTTV